MLDRIVQFGAAGHMSSRSPVKRPDTSVSGIAASLASALSAIDVSEFINLHFVNSS